MNTDFDYLANMTIIIVFIEYRSEQMACHMINILQYRSAVCEDSGFVKDVIKKGSHSDLE